MSEEEVDQQLEQRKILAQIPRHFLGLFQVSFLTYQRHFIQFFIFSLVTYLPFIILNEVTSFDTLGFSGFIVSRLFDILVFMAMPALFQNSKIDIVFIFKSFFINYFGNIVRIGLLQLCIFFPVLGFLVINPIFVIPGIIIYILFIYAGFFLILDNRTELFSVRDVFAKSFVFGKASLLHLARNIIGISIATTIPVITFVAYLVYTHASELNVSPEAANLEESGILDQLRIVISAPQFKWGLTFIQTLIRPLESIFMSYLFIQLIQKAPSGKIYNYLFKSSQAN